MFQLSKWEWLKGSFGLRKKFEISHFDAFDGNNIWKLSPPAPLRKKSDLKCSLIRKWNESMLAIYLNIHGKVCKHVQTSACSLHYRWINNSHILIAGMINRKVLFGFHNSKFRKGYLFTQSLVRMDGECHCPLIGSIIFHSAHRNTIFIRLRANLLHFFHQWENAKRK